MQRQAPCRAGGKGVCAMAKYVVKKVLKYLLCFLGIMTIVYFILENAPGDPGKVILGKPVIYLYPTETTQVRVDVELARGTFTATEPPLGDGWQVTAQPDGTLTGPDGESYSYLFWEADAPVAFDFSSGFVVPGRESEGFLREKLAYLGLNQREIADFLAFWQPQMEGNPYNLVAFQTERYTEEAQLRIEPQPDQVIRVFMACRPLDGPVEVPEQVLQPAARRGFTAVEWGGSMVE